VTVNRDELIESFVEVKIDSSDDFLKVRETLTRMGIADRKTKTLYQSCHILHKKGKYYILHFKELFALDGREVNFSDEDKARRNSIAQMLERWGMVKFVKSQEGKPTLDDKRKLAIIPYSEKENWDLKPKYSIGSKQKAK
jgi:hypothetical protein